MRLASSLVSRRRSRIVDTGVNSCDHVVTAIDTSIVQGKRVLVTGGAGFIGSHLVAALADHNEVVVLDDLSTGSRERVPSDVEFVRGDVRDRETVRTVMDGVDVVFHEAAVVSVSQSVEEPAKTHDINVTGTVNVLEAARATDARVVVASSAAVYGQPESVPISEDAPVTPTSPYGLSKAMCDEYVALYAALYDLDAVGLRYFNVYGPGQTGGDYSGVISIFFEQAQAGGPLTVHGDGTQTRDFVHVRDVVQANLLAAADGVPGAVYNVGTGERVSIQELAELVCDVCGEGSVEVRHVSERTGDIEHSQANIEQIQSALAFEPTVDLKAGLADLSQTL